MSSSFVHYVKLARSLALTSTLILPACGGDPPGKAAAPAPSSPEGAGGGGGEMQPEAVAAAGSGGAGGQGAGGQGGGGGESPSGSSGTGMPDAGHISGPLPPPELPGGFALA